MEKLKDFRKSGSFRLSSGIEMPGELSLKGGRKLARPVFQRVL